MQGLKPQYRVIALALLVVSAVMLLVCNAQAAGASALSRWLSDTTVPELRKQLASHPRFQGSKLQLVALSDDALTAAVITLLHKNLAAMPQLVDVQQAPAGIPRGAGASIDALQCHTTAVVDYQLGVQVVLASRGQQVVRLVLTDRLGTGRALETWQWQGQLARAERNYAQRQVTPAPADGSVGAPWQAQQLEQAAAALSYQLACELRPYVQQTVGLQTISAAALPGAVRQTLAVSSQLLAGFREVEVSTTAADYQLGITMTPFGDNVWQLWLEAAPRSTTLGRAQAVTYLQFEDNSVGSTVVPQVAAATLASAVPVPVPLPAGSPSDYLQVALVEAAQEDRSGARADLLLTLELQNNATAPLAYSLTTSGGHFNHCIARAGNYRHDAYGTVAGVIAPGATILRRLRVTAASHRPTPLLGTRRCAGFRDLKAFEEYAHFGRSVTDYVRWQQ